MSKLGELKDAKAWALWLKNEFDAADDAARAAVEEELRRSRDLPGKGTKAKWKMRIRILSASHSIRPKATHAAGLRADPPDLTGRDLNATEIIEILNARLHPSRRKA